MRKIAFLFLTVLIVFACSTDEASVDENGVPYPNLELENFKHRISYALGADIGANFNNVPDDVMVLFDLKALEEGFYIGLTDKDAEKPNCRPLLEAVFARPNDIDTSLYDMEVVSDCYGFIFGEMLRKNLDGREAYNQIDVEMSKKGFAHALYKVDTIIPLDERGKMIVDFNNDMNRISGERFMESAGKKPNAIVDERGWVMIENLAGTGEAIDPNKEFRMIYTLMKPNGDTIISTIMDEALSDDKNAQVVNTDDIIIPNGWVYVASKMNVGGSYDLYLPYELAFGERGLINQRGTSYIVQPYSSIKISLKILEQGELHSFAKKRGEKVLAEARKKPNTRVGKSGYILEVIKEGEGEKVPAGSDVKAHYILTNSAGDEIENSYAGEQSGRGVPAFSLKSVIKGWQDAVPEMRKGGKYRLYLPYYLAYGEQGNQGIPPFETLTFEMEIIDFGQPNSLTKR